MHRWESLSKPFKHLRSHRPEKQEFCQPLTHKGDVDLEKKFAKWESFCNYHRTHGAFAGTTRYEALRERVWEQ